MYHGWQQKSGVFSVVPLIWILLVTLWWHRLHCSSVSCVPHRPRFEQILVQLLLFGKNTLKVVLFFPAEAGCLSFGDVSSHWRSLPARSFISLGYAKRSSSIPYSFISQKNFIREISLHQLLGYPEVQLIEER